MARRSSSPSSSKGSHVRTVTARAPKMSAAASSSSSSYGSLSSGQGVSAYDAATNSPTRSSFVAFPTNSRRELPTAVREEIIRKARALEANLPEMTRIHRKYARHAVGSGINFRCLSEDREFNDNLRRVIENWWASPMVYSIDGSMDGWNAKHFAVESILGDGEFNASLVVTKGGWPMIQPWDVFEIKTPQGVIDGRPVDVAQWDDGVQISANERPEAFSVRTLPRFVNGLQTNFSSIPVQSMIHLGRRRRVRGHRFMPACYSGLNQGVDGLDLGSLIAGTAKLHSALLVQVKKPAKKGQKGAIGKIQNVNAGESEVDTDAAEKVFGAMINYVGENGEIDLKSSAHPGQNLLEFKRLLMAELCFPYDLPPTVMLDMSGIGGTAVRGDIEDAQSAFDMMYDLISWQFVRREIIWAAAVFIQSGRLAPPKDPWWFTKIVTRGPRKLTVDIGRMANAFKILTRNAGLSIPRFFEEQNLDAYDEMRDNITFLKEVRAMCEAEGVPVEWLYEPTPGTQTNINVQSTDPNA